MDIGDLDVRQALHAGETELAVDGVAPVRRAIILNLIGIARRFVLASEGADGWANFVQHKILEERDYLTDLLTLVVADLHRNILGEVKAMLDQALTTRIRGTFDAKAKYVGGDVVVLDGGSFIARQDNPGSCPGVGWQLMAKQGQRGIAGPRGERGKDAPVIEKWIVNRGDFTVTPVYSNGIFGPVLNLQELFAPSQADTVAP